MNYRLSAGCSTSGVFNFLAVRDAFISTDLFYKQTIQKIIQMYNFTYLLEPEIFFFLLEFPTHMFIKTGIRFQLTLFTCIIALIMVGCALQTPLNHIENHGSI